MMRSKLSFLGSLSLFCAIFAAATTFGQTTNAIRPITPRPVPLVIRPTAQTGSASQNTFNNLVSSAAGLDMDSPVEARAEFDPPTASLGAHVLYRIVVTALDESLKVPDVLPAPTGLELKPGGRAQIYQPSAAMKLHPETTIIYHVTASTNGIFKMPSFDATAYGKPVKVPEATLTVNPASAAPSHEPPRLVMDIPPGDIYVGQPIKIPVLLPQPDDHSIQAIYQTRITGEFVFSESFMSMRRETIHRDGRTFLAFIQEIVLTPLREGRQVLVAQTQAVGTRQVPGQTNSFQSYNSLVDSEPLTIDIKPLPKEGQLPGFTGAIGNFQIDPPKLSTNEIRAGDPVTLSVSVHGDGDIGRLTLPPLPFSRDWQSFPPIGENLPAAFIQMRGSNVFSYTLIPLSAQLRSTPPIPFCYFDPEKKEYVNLTIPPLPLTVDPGPAGTTPAARTPDVSSGASDDSSPEKELALTGLAETPGPGVASLVPVQQRWWFLALQAVPVLVLGGLWGWDQRRRHLEKHPEIILKCKARRGLRRELRQARRAAAARDAGGFVSGAANALREACAPHGAANPEALVCADVLKELPAADRLGAPGDVVRRLFAAADARRFGGPSRDAADLLSLKPEVERVLEQLKARL